MEVSGAHAIVTCGASGLGAATARWLSRQGMNVSIVDVDEASGRLVTNESGGLFLKAFVRDAEDVNWALDEACAKYRPAYILVNCGGVAPNIPMFGAHRLHPADVFRSILETNLVGTFLMASRFATQRPARRPDFPSKAWSECWLRPSGEDRRSQRATRVRPLCTSATKI
ncbi:SDR family NAD(P)-dependent oxidoreductase [Croceicoccus sp. BE223]|uniref:SDR family NAD(P)-dependent oxidoreductase n=1 Tax=Croceicoccus sp. BE223 TaxID=2817716 RepID=UPI0038576F33